MPGGRNHLAAQPAGPASRPFPQWDNAGGQRWRWEEVAMIAQRAAYLEAAGSAVTLLSDPAVAASWDQPSALAHLAVSGLAGHLASQILTVPLVLGHDTGAAEPVSLLAHYSRVSWIGAGLDAEINGSIR